MSVKAAENIVQYEEEAPPPPPPRPAPVKNARCPEKEINGVFSQESESKRRKYSDVLGISNVSNVTVVSNFCYVYRNVMDHIYDAMSWIIYITQCHGSYI